jgi:hypothetical protein
MATVGQQGGSAAAAVNSTVLLEHAMAVIAKTVDPAILALPGSHDRLMPAIAHALAHFEAAAAAIPGPLAVSTQRHGMDPVLAKLFPSADEIAKGLGCSLAVRNSLNWFVEHGHDTVHAVLGMRLRAGTDAAAAGELRFADHTFRSLAASDADARECLCEAAFSGLINAFAKSHQDSQRKWRLHQTELRLHHDDPTAAAMAALAEPTPAIGLERLIEQLQTPERHMRVAIGDGHPAVTPAGDGADSLRLPWLATTDRRTWLVCLAEFPLAEALEAIQRQSLVHRYILV